MELRDFRPDPASGDARATLDVFRRAVHLTASRDYTPEQLAAWAPEDLDEDAWAVSRASARTRVACDGHRVVGFTDVDRAGYVDMMFVDPDAAGRGVATALLAWAEASARRDGATELTTHASLTARPFFEARGFVVVHQQHPELRGVRLVNFAMSRALGAPGR